MAGSFDDEYNALNGRIGVIYDVAQAKGATAPMPAADQRNTYNLSGYVNSIQTSTPQPIDAFVEYICEGQQTSSFQVENAYIDLDILLSNAVELSVKMQIDTDLSGLLDDVMQKSILFGFGVNAAVATNIQISKPTSLSTYYIVVGNNWNMTQSNLADTAFVPFIQNKGLDESSGIDWMDRPQFTVGYNISKTTGSSYSWISDGLRQTSTYRLNYSYYPVFQASLSGYLVGETKGVVSKTIPNYISDISPMLFGGAYSPTTSTAIGRRYCASTHILVYGLDLTVKMSDDSVIHRNLKPARKGTTYGMYDLVGKRFYTQTNSVGTISGGPDVYVI